jgi:hypothetical protein
VPGEAGQLSRLRKEFDLDDEILNDRPADIGFPGSRLRTLSRPWIGTLYGPPEVAGDQMVGRDGRGPRRRRDTGLAFTMYRYDGPAAPQRLCGLPQPVQLVKPADPTDPAINRVLATIRSVIGLSPSSSLLPSRSGRISGSGAIPAIYQTAIERQDLPHTCRSQNPSGPAQLGGNPSFGSASDPRLRGCSRRAEFHHILSRRSPCGTGLAR